MGLLLCTSASSTSLVNSFLERDMRIIESVPIKYLLLAPLVEMLSNIYERFDGVPYILLFKEKN